MSAAEIELDAERAIVKTLLGLGALLAGLLALGLLFSEQILAGSRWFVDTLGPWGVALGFLIPDATALPLPHEVFLAAGLIGGLPFGQIVLWASAGSLIGGTIAFAVGRVLAGTDWFASRSGRRVQRARGLFERYGAVALAASAVSPLPYSVMAWTSGGLGLPAWQFLLISLLRVPRVAGYLWAIQIGYVEVML